jgi:hypothetical protein
MIYFQFYNTYMREANIESFNFHLCMLSFDEVKISENAAYNARSDQILGPHRQAQVAIIRGLLYPYKQPIDIQFDQSVHYQHLLCCALLRSPCAQFLKKNYDFNVDNLKLLFRCSLLLFRAPAACLV